LHTHTRIGDCTGQFIDRTRGSVTAQGSSVTTHADRWPHRAVRWPHTRIGDRTWQFGDCTRGSV